MSAAFDSARNVLIELMRIVRSRRTCWALLSSSLLLVDVLAIASPVKASLAVSSQFWSICISAFDVQENFASRGRNDLAGRVAAVVQTKMDQVERSRKVLSEPNCIRGNQPGFDRQLFLDLSIKRQEMKLDDRNLNLIIAGGVARNGLFQDRDLQPVVILKREQITDAEVVNALVEFVDRSVVEVIRQQQQK